jgi:GT2 family glycosyltransferase
VEAGARSKMAGPLTAVVVATIGRPDLTASMLARLARQTRPPDYVLLTAHKTSDLPVNIEEIVSRSEHQTVILYGEVGCTKQRNHALGWLEENTPIFSSDDGAIVFFDDDFVMRSDWLARLIDEFAADSNLVGVTGVVLADGVALAGYSEAEADSILRHATRRLPRFDFRLKVGSVQSLYGCNMAMRAAAMRGLRFDEGLPLHGWLEDLDFSALLARKGRLMRSAALIGVHLGTKHGRGSSVRYGYSQVANPVYLCGKGTMESQWTILFVIRNLLANAVRALHPEPFIDRKGRLSGNLRALRDMFHGRLDPRHIESI